VGGPQGTYVTLASTGTTYNGTSTFSTNVTVQNRSAQTMGTANGTTPHADGVRVFFLSGPAVTAGTGTVDVANEDGTATITAAGQAYFTYPGVLAPGQTSAPKLWSFNVPNTVTTFSFTVLVNARVPDEAGVLRWVSQNVGPHPFDEIAEACGQLWAVGGTSAQPGPPPVPGVGTIQHYSGTTWASQADPVADQVLHSVDMVRNGGTATGVAVGESGTILHYNGTAWASRPGGAGTLMSVARVGTEWFVVGLDGVIFHSTDGLTWTPQTSGVTDDLIVVGGPAANNVYIGGENGRLLHSSGGGTWTSVGYSSGTTNTIRAATGVGSEIWLLGDNGTITRSTNGTTFTAQTSGTTQALYGVESMFDASVNLYAVGANGTILNYNGTAWSPQSSGGTTILNDVVIRINGTTFVDAWAVGNGGTILRGTR
jgi:hypothetical protein